MVSAMPTKCSELVSDGNVGRPKFDINLIIIFPVCSLMKTVPPFLASSLVGI